MAITRAGFNRFAAPVTLGVLLGMGATVVGTKLRKAPIQQPAPIAAASCKPCATATPAVSAAPFTPALFLDPRTRFDLKVAAGAQFSFPMVEADYVHVKGNYGDPAKWQCRYLLLPEGSEQYQHIALTLIARGPIYPVGPDSYDFEGEKEGLYERKPVSFYSDQAAKATIDQPGTYTVAIHRSKPEYLIENVGTITVGPAGAARQPSRPSGAAPVSKKPPAKDPEIPINF